MQTAVETLEDDKVRIRVEIDAHDVDHAFEHALSDLAKDVRVPGFRKGKAPVPVVRQRIGEEAVRDEALRSHINGWWRRALAAAGVDGIGQPEIDWEEPPIEGAPFTFTGTVQVPPKAVLPPDLELAAVKPDLSVPDDYVDGEVERIRAAGASFEVAAVKVESGHQVLVDMHGTIDGNAIKDAQATDLLVEAGAGRLLDDLDEALIGMQAGESREVTVTLPKEQKPKKLAGRDAVFAVTVKEVRVRVLPDLDDAFAKQVAGFDTLKELRDDIRQGREQNLEREADGQFRRNVLQDLGAQVEVDVPSAMVGRRIDDRLQSMARSLGQQGIELEQYLRMMGRDLNTLAMELAPECDREVREELALDAYIARYGIAVTDDDLQAFIAEQAAAEGEGDEVVERIMGDPAMREDVRRDLVLKNGLDHAVGTAQAITPEAAEARANARTGSATDGSAAEQNREGVDDTPAAPEQES